MKRVLTLVLALALIIFCLSAAGASVLDEVIKLGGGEGLYLVQWQTEDSWSSGHWSLVDADGNIIVDQFADLIYKLTDEVYEVIRDGVYGIMDSTGSFIIEPRFDYIGSYFHDGMLKVEENGLYGFLYTRAKSQTGANWDIRSWTK